MTSNRGSVPWLQDADVTLYLGDALATLRELPAESVDCVVTSPPYWGLRDYGTGEWEGGEEGCDHRVREDARIESSTLGGGKSTTGHQREGFKDVCPRCGATRIDQQLGLEPTPEQYVECMVEVFREVRRVLAAHGTVWLNLGDSYAASSATGHGGWDGNNKNSDGTPRQNRQAGDKWARTPTAVSGLKPKDLVGIPWRVAFALQADGWYLRSDIIWAKPNPMPESVTDRPTKAHEYVFLLSKQPRYFFDQEAVRESHTSTRWGGPTITQPPDTKYAEATANGFAGAAEALSRPGREWNAYPQGGRNIRSVWEIATQPYPEAHFATFPEELARRCIAAGCPQQVCRVCGKARERVVERGELVGKDRGGNYNGREIPDDVYRNYGTPGMAYERIPAGFTDCGHADYRPGVVLDPFMGSGTVAYVARKLGRHAVGIDLSAEYLALAAKRLQQQSLFAEASSDL